MKKTIIIFILNIIGCVFVNAQVSTLGTITDELGQPIPGVNILEKGTNNGVVSDFDGRYTIEVHSNATLFCLIICIDFLGLVK